MPNHPPGYEATAWVHPANHEAHNDTPYLRWEWSSRRHDASTATTKQETVSKHVVERSLSARNDTQLEQFERFTVRTHPVHVKRGVIRRPHCWLERAVEGHTVRQHRKEAFKLVPELGTAHLLGFVLRERIIKTVASDDGLDVSGPGPRRTPSLMEAGEDVHPTQQRLHLRM